MAPVTKFEPLMVSVCAPVNDGTGLGETVVTMGEVEDTVSENTGPSSTSKSIPWFGDVPSVTPPQVC